MPEMLSYIFSTLGANDRAIRNQMRVNRNFVIFAVAISAYSFIQTKKIISLQQKVKELSEKNEG